MVSFQKYHFQCKWTSDAMMPRYWGSALRGGLGKWLRKTSCVLRSRQCSGCAVRASCAYGFIFETETASGAQFRNVNTRPHPIVIEVPFPSSFATEEGADFEFSVILIDKANDFLPHLIYSIMKLGTEDGLGAKTRQGQGRFKVISATSSGHTVFSGSSGQITRPPSLKRLDLSEDDHDSCSRLEVRFETPFRVKYRGKFIEHIPFHVLIRAALRRVSSLEAAYGQGEPELDYPGLISEAEKVETASEDLKWREVPRYSSRQKKRMMIGGPAGSVVYKGDLARFLPFLKYCETVHLGKQTFFGLGKIKLKQKD